MAAIDKTYGTYAQSVQLWNWLRNRSRKWTRMHYGTESFSHLAPEDERPIINTRVSDDKLLARFCPFPFVLERICEVYRSDAPIAKLAAQRLSRMAAPCLN